MRVASRNLIILHTTNLSIHGFGCRRLSTYVHAVSLKLIEHLFTEKLSVDYILLASHKWQCDFIYLHPNLLCICLDKAHCSKLLLQIHTENWPFCSSTIQLMLHVDVDQMEQPCTCMHINQIESILILSLSLQLDRLTYADPILICLHINLDESWSDLI